MITRPDIAEALAYLTGNASDKTPPDAEITLQAWCDYFANHSSWTGDNLMAAVVVYCDTPRERLVQPADLGEIIRNLRRDRYDRADPDTRDDPWTDLGGQRALPNPDGTYTDTKGTRRDRYGMIDKSAPDIELTGTRDERRAAYWRLVEDSNTENIRLRQPPATDDQRQQAMQTIIAVLNTIPEAPTTPPTGTPTRNPEDGPQPPTPYETRLNAATHNPLLVKCGHCGAEPGTPCHVPGTHRLLKRLRGHPTRIEAAQNTPTTPTVGV